MKRRLFLKVITAGTLLGTTASVRGDRTDIQNSEIRDILKAQFSGLQGDSVQVRQDRVTRAAEHICNPCDHLSEYALENVPCDRVSVEDLKAMEEPGNVSRQLLRLEYIIEVFNENFDSNLEKKWLNEPQKKVNKVARYAPLFGSYNHLRDCACAVDVHDQESVEEFYIATALFAVELMFFYTGVPYKASFKITRGFTHATGLSRIANHCGWRCYALTMSEVHWAIRGTFYNLDTIAKRDPKTYILSNIRKYELDIDIERDQLDGLEFVDNPRMKDAGEDGFLDFDFSFDIQLPDLVDSFFG